jgi:cytochrome c-type biogenesis protein CcmF
VATFRVFVNPLVSLIWVGGAIFLAGTLICVWPVGVRRPVLAPTPRPVPEGVQVGA